MVTVTLSSMKYLIDDRESAAINYVTSKINKVGKVLDIKIEDDNIDIVFELQGDKRKISKKIDDLFISPDMRDMYMKYDIDKSEIVS